MCAALSIASPKEECDDLVVNTDPACLPPAIAIKIFSLAFAMDAEDESSSQGLKKTPVKQSSHLRTVAPRVSRRWHQLLNTEAAHAVLWRKVHLYDCCIPTKDKFSIESFKAFWTPRLPFVKELNVEVTLIIQNKLEPITEAVTNLIGAARNMKSLRITGKLPVGAMLSSLGDQLSMLTSLSTVYLCGGAQTTWEIDEAVQALQKLPALEKFEIRFDNDIEDIGGDVLGSICNLSSLRHLSLQWPLRSALPPFGELPPSFSSLSSLTTLQLKRVPQQTASPDWLVNFSALEHLFWDPYLPVDIAGVLPHHLSTMSLLKTLYAEMRPPLTLPTSLTALERLALIGRGMPDVSVSHNHPHHHPHHSALAAREQNHFSWQWLDPLTRLVSLRLQGGRMATLPPGIHHLRGLTRLELMCNDLTAEALVPGPWLQHLCHLHLGLNRIQIFPSALRQATSLRSLHLANQRSVGGAIQGPLSVTQRLRITGNDVIALLAAPRLETVVMGASQPQVIIGGRTCDFSWLQRVLRQRQSAPVKLTSNELMYELESMEVFRVPHLHIEEL